MYKIGKSEVITFRQIQLIMYVCMYVHIWKSS